jgi:hypothetical protein
MAWYSIGTVSLTNNSNVVTGLGTAFVANARGGDAFLGPDGNWYEIINIASDTVMSISPNYLGTTGSALTYKIVPIQGYVKSSADLLRTVTNDISSRLDVIEGLDATELSYLNGVTANIQVQLDSKFTGNPSYLSDRANHTGTQSIATISGLQIALDNKQPISTVLTNTTASFTTAAESKLSGIASGATANQADSYLLQRSNHIGTQNINTISGLQTALDGKQPISTVLTGTTASFTTSLETKLNGIAAGATVNAADSALRDRATHTGTQAMGTIIGLAAEFATKQPLLVSGFNIATINGQSILNGTDIQISGDIVLNGIQTLNGKSGATVNLVPADIGAATASQGALADSAIQNSTMVSYVSTQLTPYASTNYVNSQIATRATSAQGVLADSALQPGAIENNAYVKRIRTLALAAI